MANTYKSIASITVGSGGANYIEFTNIPSTYTDLIVKASLRDNRSDAPMTDIKVSFNGAPGGTSYTYQVLSKDASNGVFAAGGSSAAHAPGLYEDSDTATVNTFSTFEMYLPNYTSSSFKSVSLESFGENNSSDQYGGMASSLWSSTSAITSIRLTPYYAGLAYKQHSTATLYGISKS
jgi:hypothetical protein